MRNKRYILSFLFLISIVMLVVPTIPHHHHANGLICMKNDVPLEAQCPEHHHQQKDDSCCNDECLTRFNSPTPTVQADGGPHYLFIAILFNDFILENLLKPRERQIKNCYAYRETLHSTVINRATSLRAPPYALA